MSATICSIYFFYKNANQDRDCKLKSTALEFHSIQVTYHNISLQKLGRVYSNADSALILWPYAT